MVTRSLKPTRSARLAGHAARRLTLAGALAGIALGAAACGSSSAATTTTTVAAGGGSTTSPAGGGTVTVRAATAAGKPALVDAQGFTLYEYALDKPGKIACTGACTTTWPPLLVPSGSHLSMSMGGLGTETRPGGQVQVTYKGSPLYTFSGDSKAGQANGVGIPDWSVASSSAVPSSTVTTTSSSGGGYGY